MRRLQGRGRSEAGGAGGRAPKEGGGQRTRVQGGRAGRAPGSCTAAGIALRWMCGALPHRVVRADPVAVVKYTACTWRAGGARLKATSTPVGCCLRPPTQPHPTPAQVELLKDRPSVADAPDKDSGRWRRDGGAGRRGQQEGWLWLCAAPLRGVRPVRGFVDAAAACPPALQKRWRLAEGKASRGPAAAALCPVDHPARLYDAFHTDLPVPPSGRLPTPLRPSLIGPSAPHPAPCPPTLPLSGLAASLQVVVGSRRVHALLLLLHRRHLWQLVCSGLERDATAPGSTVAGAHNVLVTLAKLVGGWMVGWGRFARWGSSISLLAWGRVWAGRGQAVAETSRRVGGRVGGGVGWGGVFGRMRRCAAGLCKTSLCGRICMRAGSPSSGDANHSHSRLVGRQGGPLGGWCAWRGWLAGSGSGSPSASRTLAEC